MKSKRKEAAQLLRSELEINQLLENEKIYEGDYIAPSKEILYDALVAVAMGKNLLLKGGTGSGKTKLVEYIAKLLNKSLQSINCSVDLDSEALLGFKTLTHEEDKAHIQFIDGPVIQSMKNGNFLYIDELNVAKPDVLSIVNGVLDYRRSITNPFTAEVITAKEGFSVIAAMNVGYVGTTPLNEALKNRFVVVEVPYVQGDQLKRLLENQSQLKDEKLLQSFVQLSADFIRMVKTGQVSEEVASIRGLLDACDLSCYMPPLRAVTRAIVDKLDDQREKDVVKNIAETVFGV
ncbi:AAA family ATPase [Brevibacillus ginsengisoli]|uniref:AAA family ATPase n=1 Tax=Brevibacillus ginsengisoli TaxID=363854 RepID=UPI003CEED344